MNSTHHAADDANLHDRHATQQLALPCALHEDLQGWRTFVTVIWKVVAPLMYAAKRARLCLPLPPTPTSSPLPLAIAIRRLALIRCSKASVNRTRLSLNNCRAEGVQHKRVWCATCTKTSSHPRLCAAGAVNIHSVLGNLRKQPLVAAMPPSLGQHGIDGPLYAHAASPCFPH